MRGIRVNERLLIITTTETGYTAQGATVTSNDDYIVRFTLDSGEQSNSYLRSIYKEDGVWCVSSHDCNTEYAAWQDAMVSVQPFWQYYNERRKYTSDQNGWHALYALIDSGKLKMGEIATPEQIVEGYAMIGVKFE